MREGGSQCITATSADIMNTDKPTESDSSTDSPSHRYTFVYCELTSKSVAVMDRLPSTLAEALEN